MKTVYCPYCGGRAKRNGRTSLGSQRWRCTDCGASTTVRCGDTAAGLEEFLGRLLSKDSQATMPGGGRSFRSRTAEFREVWPCPSASTRSTGSSSSTAYTSPGTSSSSSRACGGVAANHGPALPLACFLLGEQAHDLQAEAEGGDASWS